MTDWRKELNGFFQKTEETKEQEERSELAGFIADTALPAFGQLSEELEKHGRDVTIRNSVTSATIIVSLHGDEELTYRIQGRTFPNNVLPYAEIRFRERKGLKLIKAESMFRSGPPDYTLSDITIDEIITNFLDHYTRRAQVTDH